MRGRFRGLPECLVVQLIRLVEVFVAGDRLVNGKTLALEIKGEDAEQNRAKRAAMEAWVGAVNAKGGSGVIAL